MLGVDMDVIGENHGDVSPLAVDGGVVDKENLRLGEISDKPNHRTTHGGERILRQDMDRNKIPARPLSLSSTLSHPHPATGRNKPGVILLGRGNSFSLGRSEVILLHHRQRPSSVKARLSTTRGLNMIRPPPPGYADPEPHHDDNDDDDVTDNDACAVPLRMVEESRTVSLNSTPIQEVNEETESSVPSPSPPPVSNGSCDLDGGIRSGETQDVTHAGVYQLEPSYQEELAPLWHRVESLMARSTEQVRRVLQDYGIGEPGGGGGGEDDHWDSQDGGDVEERKKEEEEMWHMIEDGSVQV